MSDQLSRIALRILLGMLTVAGLLAAASCHGQEPAPQRVVKAFRVCTGNYCLPYEWRELANDPQRHHLFRAGTQIGAWCYRDCVWRDFDGRSWGPPLPDAPFQVPGIPAPPAPANETDEPRRIVGQMPPGIPDGGVDVSKMREYKGMVGGGFRYEKNGRPISREEAFREFGEIPDDAESLRVTWIGPPADADKLRRDLDMLAEWKGKVSFQSYASLDEPMLAGKGFQTGLQIQSADGRRLGAESSYTGPEVLAEGLRNADRRRRDPLWRPAIWPPLRDPDQPSPLDGLRDLSSATAWLKRHGLTIAVVVIVTAILIRRTTPPKAT